jgi:uncharacterized membrane protein
MTGVSELRRMPDGFLERGAQVTRLEAFVDAAFAFAVTLLVISLDAIPDSIPALMEAMKGVPAFAASFAQIAFFWHAHAGWSKRYGLDDAASTWLSLAMVFLVLVYVYPLKIVYGALFFWLSAGWFRAPVPFGSLGDLAAMFAVYGIAFATLSACMLALYAHAWRRRDALGLDAAEAAMTRRNAAAWCWRVIVALLSLLAAWVLSRSARVPIWLTGAPGMAYLLMPLSRVFASAFERRARAGTHPERT